MKFSMSLFTLALISNAAFAANDSSTWPHNCDSLAKKIVNVAFQSDDTTLSNLQVIRATVINPKRKKDSMGITSRIEIKIGDPQLVAVVIAKYGPYGDDGCEIESMKIIE